MSKDQIKQLNQLLTNPLFVAALSELAESVAKNGKASLLAVTDGEEVLFEVKSLKE